jgi:hypothetical protein
VFGVSRDVSGLRTDGSSDSTSKEPGSLELSQMLDILLSSPACILGSP